jgi:carbon monoxide dehydrogenase subunit G
MLTLTNTSPNIAKPAEAVFEKISRFSNFQGLMPEQVERFEATDDTCILGVKGLPPLHLKMTERIAPEKVLVTTEGKNPVSFELLVQVQVIDASNSTITFTFSSDLNPMMKMMLEKPLSYLVKQMAERAPALFV